MIPETVREAARRFGDRPAYVDEDRRALAYTELDRRSDKVAAGMKHSGLGEGDVVALVLPPGLDYVVSYAAAAKIGAITAGINERLTAPERAAVLETAAPALVLEHGDEVSALERGDAEAPALGDDPDRPVAIVFTSGTTGIPKGALFTDRQLAFITTTDVGENWGGGGATIGGTAFAHLGFMTKLPGSLRRGGTTQVLRRWRADDALALVERTQMRVVAGVPTQLALMLRSDRFERTDVSSVQALIVGGAPLAPDLATEARARFGAALATRYSCTEAGLGLGTDLADPPDDAVVSVGRPLPGVELALLADDDRPVPDGEVGAVCLRSPAVMREYWRDPTATAAAFTAEGFVRTGDLGWLDEHGRLHLVGRTKERYVRGGYNVYPVEVEHALVEHPSVDAIVIVPRQDAVMGEIGVAVVVPTDPDDPPSLEALRDFGAERLAAHKLPEAIESIGDLPLTGMDKVDRRALAARVEA